MSKKTIVVPVDGSEHAKKAVEFAVDWAKVHDGQIHLIHIPEPPAGDEVLVMGGASVTIYATREELEQIGQTIIDAATKMVKELGLNDVDGSISIGNPARQIVKKAEDLKADMIVMGTRGLGDWKSLLVGSVSHKVMQMAPCTCVTVR